MTTVRRCVGVVALVSVGAGLFAACGGDDAPSTGADVTGVVWQLSELGGEPVPDGIVPTLEFDGARVAGSGGCNNYGSNASFEDGAVTIAPEIMSTRMACQPAVTEVETQFFQVLPTVSRFAVDGDTLTLTGDADEVLLVFTASA